MLVCSSVLNDAGRADSGCTTGGTAGSVNLGRRIHPERIAASRGREPSGLYAQRKKFVNSEVPELKVSFWKILPIHCSASAGDNRNQGNQNLPFSICS